ncbi:hypothetical protein [uncultured Prevotella sp.]|uniref:hypothetical protein n=1 Tax=uncultured Prevotella sp. TaxID=159272 RepID=UPI00260669E3|nr:hypothetical protein [uncultured Prevotella sp.]
MNILKTAMMPKGSVTKSVASSPLLQGFFLLPLSPHKPFEQEGQEVGEGIELAVLHNTLSQNSKGKRLENHKIPYVFVVKITKFLILLWLCYQKIPKYRAKKKRQPSQATASNLQ